MRRRGRLLLEVAGCLGVIGASRRLVRSREELNGEVPVVWILGPDRVIE